MLVGQTFRLDGRYFQFLLAAKFFVMPFFFPVVLLFIRFDLKFVKYLMHFSLKFLPWLLLVMLTVLASLNMDAWQEQLYRLHIFNFALPLVLLNIHYLNGKSRQRMLLIIYFLGLIAIGSYYGRRGYVLDMLFMFAFYFLLTSMNKVVSIGKKVRLFVVISLVVFGFFMMFSTLKSNVYIFEGDLILMPGMKPGVQFLQISLLTLVHLQVTGFGAGDWKERCFGPWTQKVVVLVILLKTVTCIYC
jgi:hypothetical protein